ncbi:MAG TPA: DUF3987 domain-containing protein, partial [Gemmataceae bacterium]|nr:DUF3987 domain-containing protein [Gemmataceae bacterium]
TAASPAAPSSPGAKCLPAGFLLTQVGLYDLPTGGVAIPYKDASGRTVKVKQRTRLQAKDGSYWPKGRRLLAYGEERLEEATKAGYLTLVEGESDCWALWFHGEPALGLPGAETVDKTLCQGHVACVRTIYVVQETDAGGQQFVTNVRQRLAALGWRGTLKVVALSDAKDPSELHCRNPQGFTGTWKQALEQAGAVDVGTAAPGRTPPVRRVDPYRPFPVEALPEPVRSYVAQSATALHCDPAFVALPVLAVLASLIGNTRVIRLKRGWEEPAVIWSVVVGDSGTLKTPAFKKAVGYLYRLQKRLLNELRQKVNDHDKEVEAYKERKRKAKDDGKPFNEQPPEKPTLERVICSDTTVEKLAEILQDNLRRPLVARDELAGWLGSFTRYKQQGNTDLPNWLQMHQAGTVIVDRKTSERPTLFIENAAVSVTGGIQPGALCRALTREYMEAGLPARLLYAMPPRKAKRWSEDEVDPDVVKSHETLLDKLAALDFDRDDEGEKAPFAVKLTPRRRRPGLPSTTSGPTSRRPSRGNWPPPSRSWKPTPPALRSSTTSSATPHCTTEAIRWTLRAIATPSSWSACRPASPWPTGSPTRHAGCMGPSPRRWRNAIPAS